MPKCFIKTKTKLCELVPQREGTAIHEVTMHPTVVLLLLKTSKALLEEIVC